MIVNYFFTVLLLFFSVPLIAGDSNPQTGEDFYKIGYQLTTEKQYKQAFPYMIKAANKGHARASYDLFVMYRQGLGVELDVAKSVSWLKKSANLGDKDAQHFLGHAYEDGNGVKKNASTALQWYLKAAKQNETESMYHYAYALERGKGIAQNKEQADQWFNKAYPLLYGKANKGNKMAAYRVFVMYSQGYGVKENKAVAYKGFKRLAKEGGYTRAQYELGWFYYLGWHVKQDLFQARIWWGKAAENGHSGAKHSLKENGWN